MILSIESDGLEQAYEEGNDKGDNVGLPTLSEKHGENIKRNFVSRPTLLLLVSI